MEGNGNNFPAGCDPINWNIYLENQMLISKKLIEVGVNIVRKANADGVLQEVLALDRGISYPPIRQKDEIVIHKKGSHLCATNQESGLSAAICAFSEGCYEAPRAGSLFCGQHQTSLSAHVDHMDIDSSDIKAITGCPGNDGTNKKSDSISCAPSTTDYSIGKKKFSFKKRSSSESEPKYAKVPRISETSPTHHAETLATKAVAAVAPYRCYDPGQDEHCDMEAEIDDNLPMQKFARI